MVRETITRRNLPHWYVPGAVHFVTYRLAGTLPIAVHENLRERSRILLRQRPTDGVTQSEHRIRVYKQIFAEYDQYLDGNQEIDWLCQPKVAAVVRGNLLHHDKCKYHLLAYCIMPNHVHVVLQPMDLVETSGSLVSETLEIGETPDSRSPLSDIMHSLKSYTAHEANRILGRSGQFWQHESYDHWVRDDDELERIVAYVVFNPVKAGLVNHPHQWFFCSAHDRYLLDGEDCGYLPLPP